MISQSGLGLRNGYIHLESAVTAAVGGKVRARWGSCAWETDGSVSSTLSTLLAICRVAALRDRSTEPA